VGWLDRPKSKGKIAWLLSLDPNRRRLFAHSLPDLLHHHVAVLFRDSEGERLGGFLLAVGIANLAAYLTARPFEMKHRKLAEWINEKVGLQANEEPGVTTLTDPRRAVAQPHSLVRN
jgi:hypothetical protein